MGISTASGREVEVDRYSGHITVFVGGKRRWTLMGSSATFGQVNNGSCTDSVVLSVVDLRWFPTILVWSGNPYGGMIVDCNKQQSSIRKRNFGG